MNNLSKRIHILFSNELERSRKAMQWGGLIGFFAHPIYFVVWTYLLPQPYDNLYLRLSAAFFCIPPLLQKYWPKRFESYLVVCWHFCLVYALPFACTFLTIKNSFSTMWMMTEVMMIFVMALCISVPLLLMAYVSTGIFAAFLACILTSDVPLVLSDTDQSNLALLPVVLLCSMVFSNTMQKGRAFFERTKAITALAGSIAHEMRNPLGQMKYALEGISHLLPIPHTGNTDHVISAKTVDDIYTNIAQGLISCDRGLEVIDITLQEVSNQQINPATFEYLSAVTITEKALEEYSFESPDERNRVSLHSLNDFTFKVEETSYIYVIFNLIKNALYYFQDYPDARISIVIDYQKITINDTGPGIPKQLLNKLFNNFATADKARGTGLGLAYCYRVMQAFQGGISCDSVLGQHTTFLLTFPAISQEEIESHTKAIFQKAIPLFHHKRILVVDDQIIYHATVRQMLEDLGCQIDGAENGQVAINMLRENQYDLVVMDIIMPGKDGYSTTQDIRSGIVFHQKNIPILAHTSETPYMAKIKTQKVGMDGFVSKPCTQLELIKAVCKTMARAKKRNSFEKNGNCLKGKTILIVDDELFNRQYLEIYTNEWGMRTLHAESGQAALKILEKEPYPDIIFMDMRMPLMSGVETTQRIRSNPAHQHILIVALTGNFSEHAMQEAKAAGMNDFISKPFDQIALQQKLTQLFAEKKQQEKKSAPAKIDPAAFSSTTAEYLSANHRSGDTGEVYAYVVKAATSEVKPPGNEMITEIMAADSPSNSSSNRYIPVHQSQQVFFKDMALIDYARIKNSQSSFKDKFQEFMERMIQNLIRRDSELQTAVNNNDAEAILNALHSFLGVAGYAGAQALHQYIKLRLYPVAHAGGIPDEEAWVETVHALVTISVDVLQRDCLKEQKEIS